MKSDRDILDSLEETIISAERVMKGCDDIKVSEFIIKQCNVIMSNIKALLDMDEKYKYDSVAKTKLKECENRLNNIRFCNIVEVWKNG